MPRLRTPGNPFWSFATVEIYAFLPEHQAKMVGIPFFLYVVGPVDDGDSPAVLDERVTLSSDCSSRCLETKLTLEAQFTMLGINALN